MTDDTDEFIPDLFNAQATLRPLSDFDTADLARMSPARRTLFDSAYKAASDLAEVEAAAKQGDADIRDAKKDPAEKRKAIELLVPPFTAFDAWKLATGKQARPEPSPEDKAAAELAQAEFDACQLALNALQDRVSLTHAAVSPARKIMSQAWQSYHERYPAKSRTEAARECFARQRQTAQDIKDGKLTSRGKAQIVTA